MFDPRREEVKIVVGGETLTQESVTQTGSSWEQYT